MMGKAVSIKEGAEAVLHVNSAELTVLSFLPGALNSDDTANRRHCGIRFGLSLILLKEG